ncbi:Kin of IRRE-like protein 3 [Eumeta japonica]|uniref:Kin of IRRE-like protein 3 n=1 Tax=Eumeta variegata TaxID=151549 RepID=A0A4C1XI02_EUMVA|nr:Kin of IRRE-like protein 3 [Eumeta japonica]
MATKLPAERLTRLDCFDSLDVRGIPYEEDQMSTAPSSIRFVSWIRKRDLHILTVGVHTYSSDARFAALHADGSDEWTLRVAPAQPRDSGAYECQVSTEPKISLSFRLTVVVSKAEILAGPELFVRAGSDINLTCVAKHAPDPPSFIYWYRGDQVVNYAQRGGISVETEQRTRTSRLMIARAAPHDSGNYTCAPSSSESASVIVHVLSGERPAAMQSSAAGQGAAPAQAAVLAAAALTTVAGAPGRLQITIPTFTRTGSTKIMIATKKRRIDADHGQRVGRWCYSPNTRSDNTSCIAYLRGDAVLSLFASDIGRKTSSPLRCYRALKSSVF